MFRETLLFSLIACEKKHQGRQNYQF